MLLNETIHMTLLVDHTEVDKDKYEEYQLIRKEMAAFMKPQHPLSKKSILNCKLLEEYPHVTYNNKDSVYLLVKEKMTKHEVSVKLFFISSSWANMIKAAAQSDIIAILSTVYYSMFRERLEHIGVIEKKFEDLVSYVSMLSRPIKHIIQK